MSRRAQADINPDTPVTRKLRQRLQTENKRMARADLTRSEASREVDASIVALVDAGWTFAAVADEIGIDRRNAMARAQRHRDRTT